MPSLDEVGVRLKATGAKETAHDLRRVREETQRLGSSDTVRGIGDLNGSFGGLSSSVGGLHGTLLSASSALQTFATRGVLGLGALATAAVGFGLSTASSFERSEAAFGALLGDVQAGTALFNSLKALDLESTFELPGLAGATQQLLTAGFAGNEALAVLRSIGDVASLNQNSPEGALQGIARALGQIRGAGVIRAEEINQLQDAGLPARELLQTLTGLQGLDFQRSLEKGLTLPVEDFIGAITRGEGPMARFKNATEALQGTLSVQVSKFKGGVLRQLAEESKPLSDTIAAQLPMIGTAVSGLIDATMPGLIALTSALAEQAPGAILAATPALGRLTTSFADLFEQIGPRMPELLDLFGDLLGLLPELVNIGAELVPVLGGMVDVFSGLLDLPLGGEAFGALLTVLLGYRLLSPVIEVVKGMTTALLGLTAAQTAVTALDPDGKRKPAGGGPGVPPLLPIASKGGRFARFGGGALLGVGGGLSAAFGLNEVFDEGANTGNVLQTVGGFTAAGAAAGLAGGPLAPITVPGGAAVGFVGGVLTTFGADYFGDRERAKRDALVGQMAPGASTAPLVPASLVRGGPTSVTNQTTLAPGAVVVQNPTSNVEVAQAVQDGIRAFNEERARRE